MMVFLGGIVGGLVIAMYLPIFEMAGNIKVRRLAESHETRGASLRVMARGTARRRAPAESSAGTTSGGRRQPNRLHWAVGLVEGGFAGHLQVSVRLDRSRCATRAPAATAPAARAAAETRTAHRSRKKPDGLPKLRREARSRWTICGSGRLLMLFRVGLVTRSGGGGGGGAELPVARHLAAYDGAVRGLIAFTMASPSATRCFCRAWRATTYALAPISRSPAILSWRRC